MSNIALIETDILSTELAGGGPSAATTGPWTMSKVIESDGSVTFDIFTDAVAAANSVGGGVAYIQTCRTYSAAQIAEQEACARLIAAAPVLLKELQHVVRWFDQINAEDVKRYRAAIEKAVQP